MASRQAAMLCVLALLCAAAFSDARVLLQDICNPCYAQDGSYYICCNDGGSCGQPNGNAPTCNGGTTVIPGGNPPNNPTDSPTANPTSSPTTTTPSGGYVYHPVGQSCPSGAANPCFAADGAFFTCCTSTCGPYASDNNKPTCTDGPASASYSSSTISNIPATSSATPMENGACRSGLNPCYIADGSKGYCCATSCANGGMIPLCSGDPEGGLSSDANVPNSGPVAPTPKTSAPEGPAPTVDGAITPDFVPPLVSTAGYHSVVNPDCGIAAMHGTPVPFTNKVLMIDRTDVGATHLYLPDGSFAYAGEYDLDSNTIRAITVPSNTWCSAGSYLPDGTILNNGGGDGGGGFSANAGIRTFNDGGNLVQVANSKVTRWYPTAHNLPDGRVLLVGGDDITGSGDNQASYEFFPSDGQNPRPLELLARPNVVQAHLYPFMHLIPDGRMFIFASQSSVLLDYNSGATSDLPDLPGNIRQYPLAGGSILLPLDYLDSYKPKVMICGGGNSGNQSTPASSSCGTIDLSSPNPSWAISNTPSLRVMGYLVFLLDGTILYTGGAHDGYSGYFCSTSPNQLPSIYDPTHDTWQDVQSGSNIPRLYHHSAYLVPDGRVLIHGSNPRPDYDFNDQSIFRTQTAVETFTPWYVGDSNRPSITAMQGSGNLGGTFTVSISVPGGETVDPTKIRVAFINPGFATHTVSMNQRYVRLALASANGNDLTVRIPSNNAVLPIGPYLCTVLYKGVPAAARWISVQG